MIDESDMDLLLSNDVRIPKLGLGTWAIADEDADEAVGQALKMGYRHIDTASMYQNERGIGRAVRNSGIARSEIFVTTKLWPTNFDDPEGALELSLKRLGLDYVDLYLIHRPMPEMPQAVWKGMENIYKDELTRAIGVSNYGIAELEEVLSYAQIPPMVNQIKCSPWDFNHALLDYCSLKRIVFEAYSPLTRGTHLDDAALVSIARKHTRTPAQVLLRWNIEHGMVTIPKSSNPERMKENLAVFDFALDAEDMRVLDTLG